MVKRLDDRASQKFAHDRRHRGPGRYPGAGTIPRMQADALLPRIPACRAAPVEDRGSANGVARQLIGQRRVEHNICIFLKVERYAASRRAARIPSARWFVPRSARDRSRADRGTNHRALGIRAARREAAYLSIFRKMQMLCSTRRWHMSWRTQAVCRAPVSDRSPAARRNTSKTKRLLAFLQWFLPLDIGLVPGDVYRPRISGRLDRRVASPSGKNRSRSA